MRSLMLAHQHERFGSIAALFKPPQGQIGDDVGRVTGVLRILAVANHRRVVVRPLPDQNLVMVKSGRQRLQVPLPDQRSAVPAFSKHLWKRGLSAVKRLGIRPLSIEVRVTAG